MMGSRQSFTPNQRRGHCNCSQVGPSCRRLRGRIVDRRRAADCHLHQFDIRAIELYRYGWLDFVLPPCTKYVSKVLTMRLRQLGGIERVYRFLLCDNRRVGDPGMRING